MKIKTLMDFLNKDGAEVFSANEQLDSRASGAGEREKVIYIENARLETAGEQGAGKELLGSGTGWTDDAMGQILISEGILSGADVNRIVDYQREKGLFFGEAAIELDLVKQDDILKALSRQFGYTYGQHGAASKDMVMAMSPFGEVAEEFRSIRAHLLNDWLTPDRKMLAVMSPGGGEGRSYFAANIALAFSQLGQSTLLIDADLRSPRQHEIFEVKTRVGLSSLLAGRISMAELDMLPEKISAFPNLAILGCGPVPPNPSELLSGCRFRPILAKLDKYFDVIIIDSPSANYDADVMAIASIAGSALLVARRGYSRMDETKSLVALLNKARAMVVGAVLNEY